MAAYKPELQEKNRLQKCFALTPIGHFAMGLLEAHAGNIIKKRKITFAFEKTPRISLSCKVVPDQNREYENGIFARG